MGYASGVIPGPVSCGFFFTYFAVFSAYAPRSNSWLAKTPMSLLFVFALKTFTLPRYSMFIYYTLAAMLFLPAYILYTIPCYAICAEMASDYDERTKMRGISSMINAGAFVGAAAGLVFAELFEGVGASLEPGRMCSAAAVAFIALIFAFITHQSTKNIKLDKKGSLGIVFLRKFAGLLKLRPFKFLPEFIGIFIILSVLGRPNLYIF